MKVANIEKTLMNFPFHYRMIFTLYALENFSFVEVSKITEYKLEDVETYFNRIELILKKRFGYKRKMKKERIFEFNLKYCDAMTNNVMEAIKQENK